MSFLLTFYVAVILFFQVLSQCLYPIMLFFLGKDNTVIDLSVNWSEFSLSYSCVIICVLMLVMTLPRDTSYIRKVNAFGVFFIVIFLVFVIGSGLVAISETEYTYSKAEYDEYVAST